MALKSTTTLYHAGGSRVLLSQCGLCTGLPSCYTQVLVPIKAFSAGLRKALGKNKFKKLKRNFASLYAGYAAQPVEELAKNETALQSGQRIFASYCSVCHGTAATGAYGFPNLTDNDWLYGGSGETIKETIMNGRSGAMPAWADIIGEDNVQAVTAHVVALSGR